jgi:hypothetical protein
MTDFPLYLCHYNCFHIPYMWGVTFYVLIYLALIPLSGCVAIARFRKLKGRNIRESLLISCWLLWMLITGWQTIHQSRYFKNGPEQVLKESVEGRYRYFYKNDYDIARRIYEAVPHEHMASARLIAREPVGTGLKPCILPYVVFPRLDCQIPSSLPEYVIFLHAKDHAGYDLSGYQKVLDVDGDSSLWKKTVR